MRLRVILFWASQGLRACSQIPGFQVSETCIESKLSEEVMFSAGIVLLGFVIAVSINVT